MREGSSSGLSYKRFLEFTGGFAYTDSTESTTDSTVEGEVSRASILEKILPSLTHHRGGVDDATHVMVFRGDHRRLGRAARHRLPGGKSGGRADDFPRQCGICDADVHQRGRSKVGNLCIGVEMLQVRGIRNRDISQIAAASICSS